MAYRTQRLAVLVVDDSEDFLGVACSWIEKQPFLDVVGTARNGQEAVDAVARLAPEVVVMDAFMPVMDGFEATRRIKSHGASPWVVLVSMHDGSTMDREAFVAGADAFVAKADLARALPAAIRQLRDDHDDDGDEPGDPTPRPEDIGIEHRALQLARRLFGFDLALHAGRVCR